MFAALSYVFGQTGPTTQNVARDTNSVLLNLAKFFDPLNLASILIYLVISERPLIFLEHRWIKSIRYISVVIPLVSNLRASLILMMLSI